MGGRKRIRVATREILQEGDFYLCFHFKFWVDLWESKSKFRETGQRKEDNICGNCRVDLVDGGLTRLATVDSKLIHHLGALLGRAEREPGSLTLSRIVNGLHGFLHLLQGGPVLVQRLGREEENDFYRAVHAQQRTRGDFFFVVFL